MADFPITTADTLPPALGGNREVKRMRVIKFTHHSSANEAQKKLIVRAQELGYDAVVGVHFIAYPMTIAPNATSGGERPGTHTRWAVYGTAIGW